MARGLPSRRPIYKGTVGGSYIGWPYKDGKPLRGSGRDRSLPPDSDDDDIQEQEQEKEKEKLSSDIVTTAKPQSPSRLASQDQRLDHLKGSDQYQTTHESEFDIQEKLSSDIVTTAMPRLPSRLACSKASLRACSTPMESDQRLDHLKGSDHYQDKLSSDIVTTVKPRLPSRLSIAKLLRSSSKMRFLIHKRKASENKKKKLARSLFFHFILYPLFCFFNLNLRCFIMTLKKKKKTYV